MKVPTFVKVAAASVVVILLSAAPVLGVDETPGEGLGGYDSAGSAAAVSFQPFLPALVSTGDVPFEITFGHATSRVKSGRIASGRGALVWPGSTLADFGPVLGAAFGQDEVGAMVPKWPLQATANQDSGEVTTGVPPIVTMTARGNVDRGEGDSRIADIHIPRLVHIENVASTSVSVVSDQSVTTTSRTTLNGVSLLAGYVKAESIRSISRTTSIGSAASTSGDIDVVGLKIGGVDVSVTDDGFQVTGLPPDARQMPGAGDEPFPNQSPERYVQQVLTNLGARITLFESFKQTQGARASITQPGVVLSLDNPVGGQGPIPPGRFDIFLASTSAEAVASLPFSAPDPAVVSPTESGSDLGSPSASGSISIGPGPAPAQESIVGVEESLAEAAQGSLGGIGEGLADVVRRSDYRFDGLPMGMVVALMMAALIAARYVRNFFNSLMNRGEL